MTKSEIMAKHEVTEKELESFLKQWQQHFFSDIDFFLDAGLLMWVCSILVKAGAIGEAPSSNENMNKCVLELSGLPDCEEERIYGLALAYTSTCSHCKATSFLSESDYRMHYEEAHTVCFSSSCRNPNPVVRKPNGTAIA